MARDRDEPEQEQELEDDMSDEDFDASKEKAGKKKGGSKKRGRGGAAAAVADDDDDEEDDDEEDGGKRGGKKRRGFNFIDDIADVDDDDEEEEDDEEAEDLIDDRDVEVPDEAHAGQGYASTHRQLNREREEKSAEEIARQIEERYQSMEQGGYGYEEGDMPSEHGAVLQQALQPTNNDPKLWLLNCRPGHERELATQLLQKYYSMYRQGTPLLIKSAVALDHLKGYVYVEAEKESHVRDAVRGLRTVFISKGVKLVPLNQMVDAITVSRQARAVISRDQWVRVRNGLYKDDLARVVDVDNASQKATIRVIPRLDLQQMANRDEEARKRNPFNRGPVRAPAKPFNAEEARQLGLVMSRFVGNDSTQYIQLNSQRFVGGYLERDVALKSLTPVAGVPPVEELQRYNAAAGDDGSGLRGGGGGSGAANDLSALVAALPSDAVAKTTFMKGDVVQFVEGDLKGVEGVVENVREDGKVMVRPKVDGFNESVDFEPEDVRKLFKVGDRVRVVSGPYAGDTGIVLQVNTDNDQCILISDTTRQELKVFGRDCTTTDISNTGVEVLGEYQLHDLVQLDQHTAGVIVSIQRDAARVLTSASTPEQADVRVVRAPDIQRKIKTTKNLITSDTHNNPVRTGDYVSFQVTVSGRQQNVSGEVEFVWRGQLFLRTREHMDTGGFVCVRANKCKVRGGNDSGVTLARQVASGALGLRSTPGASPQLGGGGSRGFPYLPASPSQYAGPPPAAPVSASPGRPGLMKPPPPRMPGAGGQGGGGSYSGAAAGAVAGSQLVGRGVRVAGGQYNGYKGRVKHETGTHVQLELDAISGRIVTVEKRYIRDEAGNRVAGMPLPRAPGGMAGAGQGSDGGYGGGAGGGLGYGSRTPLHPSQTPLHPSMTPAHYSTHATPAHAPYTPMHAAPTPMDDSYGHHDDRGMLSAPTPGIGGAFTPSAYTPAAYTPSAYTPAAASTPGPYGADMHHAPTPGVQDPGTVGLPPTADTPALAPTPGVGHLSAPTPYLPSAPTPAAAATPGGDFPGMDGLVGTTPGLAGTPHVGQTPYIATTPGLPPTAATPATDLHGYLGAAPAHNYTLWPGIVVTVNNHEDDTAAVQRLGSAPDTLVVVRGKLQPGQPFAAAGQEEELPVAVLQPFRPSKNMRVRLITAREDAEEAFLGRDGMLTSVTADQGYYTCMFRVPGLHPCLPNLDSLAPLANQQSQ